MSKRLPGQHVPVLDAQGLMVRGWYRPLEEMSSSPLFEITYSDGLLNVSDGYKVNGTTVLRGRITGWTAATGTATRATFATGSVTTAQLAERVKALIDDLMTHGLIGS